MQLQGDITYNDETFKTFHPERTAAYVDQVPLVAGLASIWTYHVFVACRCCPVLSTQSLLAWHLHCMLCCLRRHQVRYLPDPHICQKHL